MGFSRQEYWSGLLCPPPGDLPDPGIEPESPTSPALAGGLFTTSATWEAPYLVFFFNHKWVLDFLDISQSADGCQETTFLTSSHLMLTRLVQEPYLETLV